MLELRPSCEHCTRPLPAAATDAMICSFECTFCRDCVEHVLANVCPNCGGGFCPRPIRPYHNWRAGNHCAVYPPSTQQRHKPVDLEAHRELVAKLATVAPERR